MATRTHKRHWTVEEVLAMPWDGKLREVIKYQLFVTNSPVLRHERAVRLLADQLRPYAATIGAEMFGAPADIVLTPETLVQPDLFVVPLETDVALLEWSQITSLLLAVEVLSPSAATRDRREKREYYQERGIGEYWIVDNRKRQVERWKPTSASAEVLRDTLSWHPVPSVEPLTIDLVRFFRKVHAEE